MFFYSPDPGELASCTRILWATALIVAASTQSGAQRLLADPALKLAVFDLRRSVETGMALIRVARTNRPDVPVVAVASADALVETGSELTALGVQVALAASSSPSLFLHGAAVATAASGGVEIKLPALRPPTVKAIDYFAAHYEEVVHGRQLAQLTNVSFFHLAHLFRTDLKVSIKEYMTGVRVEIARQLVFESTDKLDHIAELTGFSDASHLSRVFLQCLGERPSQYRNRHRDGF